jgi:uncharacterized SAM-binding protein YcdF (DUF218 family)
MEFFFLLKKALSALILPPTGPLLVCIAGLLLIRRSVLPRLGKTMAWAGVLALLLLSWGPVSGLLMRAVAVAKPLDYAEARQAQAIVVMGGGLRRRAPEYGGDTLGVLTLERVRYGAYVARRTALPVLVTGGVVFKGRSEADVMREALESEFDVPVRWAETASRDTHQNAVNSARLLSEHGVRRVVLVTHAFDMPRASREFRRAGLEVVAAPTGVPGPFELDHPLQLLPSAAAFQSSYYATYEIVANAVLWFRLLGRS